MLTFDTYLTDRIKLGQSQYNQFLCLCLVDFLDGFSIVFLTMLTNALKKEWGLTNGQIMVLHSIYYFGIVFGLIGSGLFSNWIGRKPTLIYAMIATFISILYHMTIQTYLEALLMRFVFGILFGITLPISLTICGEIIPLAMRGRVVACLQLVLLFGIYYLFICYFIFMESLSDGNWRAIFFMQSIPSFFCIIGCVIWLEESPRYNLAKKEYSKSFNRLDQMGYMNNKQSYIPLTNEEKNQLISWQINLNNRQKTMSFKDLFAGYRKLITINLWILVFFWNIQCSSVFVLLPYLFSERKRTISQLFVPYLFELPATIAIICLIDSKKWGGRKFSIIVSLLLYISAEFLLYIYRDGILIIGIIFLRMMDKTCWVSIYQLKLESYSTLNRSLGLGVANAIGKIGATICPFLVFPLFNIDPYLPFLVLGFLSLITVFVTAIHPIDLTQKALDEFEAKMKIYQ